MCAGWRLVVVSRRSSTRTTQEANSERSPVGELRARVTQRNRLPESILRRPSNVRSSVSAFIPMSEGREREAEESHQQIKLFLLLKQRSLPPRRTRAPLTQATVRDRIFSKIIVLLAIGYFSGFVNYFLAVGDWPACV